MNETCRALRHGKTECTNPASQMVCFIPLCKSHLLTLQAQFRRERERGHSEAKKIYIDRKIEERRVARSASLVYFIKAGRRVKIGQSHDPRTRLLAIRGGYSTKKPDGLDTSNARLIATEPGGLAREQELHWQFAHLRLEGEWFIHGPELKAYIAECTTKAA